MTEAYYKLTDPPPNPNWQPSSPKRDLSVALISLYVIENSGIRLLAAILRRQGITVHEIYFKDWLNNRIAPPTESETALLIQELKRLDIDLVGISVRASAFHCMASDLTARIRRDLNIPIIWGGMHPTSCPEDAARAADLICVGEAETSFLELVQRLQAGKDVRDIPGLWVHTKDGLVRNSTASLVKDLDALPFRDFHSTDKIFIEGKRVVRGKDPYADQSIYLIMCSRGCPFPSCSFCSNSVMDKLYPKQDFFRVMSIDRMFEEIAYAKKHFPNLTRIRFDDEEFPVATEWFDAFCERWPKEAGLPFEVHMDPRVVTADRLTRLKAIGLDMVFMGIQSTAKINRDLYNRDVSDEKVIEAAKAMHESGVRAGYQVILDDPVSTALDKRELFELLLKLERPYEMILFSLTVYPGSALSDELKKRGLLTDQDVEGPSTKVFEQFRVDLSYPRTPEDQFWTSLIVMVSKSFVSKSLLRRLAANESLKKRPGPVRALAFVTNLIKIAAMGFGLLIRGELSWALIRRWLSLKSLVTY